MDASEYDTTYERLKGEYDEKRSQLEKQYIDSVNLLCRDYILSNNTVKVGDIVSSKSGSRAVVDSIKYTRQSFSGRPACVYYGRLLTKSGGLRKDKKKIRLHQDEVL